MQLFKSQVRTREQLRVTLNYDNGRNRKGVIRLECIPFSIFTAIIVNLSQGSMVTSVYFGKYGFAIGVKRILKRRNGNKLKVMLPICARACVYLCVCMREKERVQIHARAHAHVYLIVCRSIEIFTIEVGDIIYYRYKFANCFGVSFTREKKII